MFKIVNINQWLTVKVCHPGNCTMYFSRCGVSIHYKHSSTSACLYLSVHTCTFNATITQIHIRTTNTWI